MESEQFVAGLKVFGGRKRIFQLMKNKIVIFKHEEFGEIRTLNIDGEPWFVGKDIAVALGYSAPRNAIQAHVDNEDKTTALIQCTGSEYKSNAVIINESGLYSLILSSKLTSAKKFKRWVTSEVLPSLRKHGAYFTAETLHKTMSDPRELAKLLTTLADEQEKRRKLEEENAFLSVKANYYDRILQSKNSVPVTQIAKDYGMTAIAFNRMLHDYGIQYSIRNSWVLYAEYANLGYTQSKTYQIGDDKAIMHTCWTQAGRIFLYNFLAERGITPMCEREDYDETLV